MSPHDKCPPKCNERSKIATQLQEALIARRIAKDNIAVNQPIVDFISSDTGKDAINKLKQKLGEVRKVEKGLQDRVYFKRKTDETPDNPVMEQNLNKMIRSWKKKK